MLKLTNSKIFRFVLLDRLLRPALLLSQTSYQTHSFDNVFVFTFKVAFAGLSLTRNSLPASTSLIGYGFFS